MCAVLTMTQCMHTRQNVIRSYGERGEMDDGGRHTNVLCEGEGEGGGGEGEVGRMEKRSPLS